jgi:hypothetical protein
MALYKVAESDNLECWIDDNNHYLTNAGLRIPFYVRKHTYDIPIQHIKLGELEGDGLALIQHWVTKEKHK